MWLALVCFFRILLGRPLPPEALVPPYVPALPAPAPAPPPPVAAPAPPAIAVPPAPAGPTAEQVQKLEESGARNMLSILQREGRLIDFLMESIDAYDDAQIGAAVRAIHTGCRKALTEHAPVEAVLPGKEESRVTVPAGFDPKQIRLVGNVVGSPPFNGTLRHHGWRVTSLKLPRAEDGSSPVVAPAEVEL